jgi:hypothetical protein
MDKIKPLFTATATGHDGQIPARLCGGADLRSRAWEKIMRNAVR